ncbi:MAG: hypothetical protein VX152_04525, partial [Pseudomonadota bacterium]|nr:hypothetical protein [Pseudomonadota bacterium]
GGRAEYQKSALCEACYDGLLGPGDGAAAGRGGAGADGDLLLLWAAVSKASDRVLLHPDTAEGVQIFIGEQTELFGLSGCSMILAPYQNQSKQVVGAVGVIGPMHMNYGRIIPMVDYTAQIVSRALGNPTT